MNSIDAVDRAAFCTVHDNGGVRLAKRMGMAPHLLLNKVNPDQTHNKLSLAEAVRLQLVTGDHRILHEIARILGYVVIRIENYPQSGPSDIELLTLYGQWNASTGAVHHEIAEALDDQIVTEAEQAAIEQRFYQATTAGLTYLHRMGGVGAMSTSPPAPPALRRVGLLSVQTNLEPGQQLALPPKTLSTLFGAELQQIIAALAHRRARQGGVGHD